MRFPHCKRCFHVIGEHLLCLEHGGESPWSPLAYRHKSKPVDPCPPEAANDYKHPWYSFLDGVPQQLATKKGPKNLFSEVVP